jgi:hypothetical protein
MPFNVIPVFLLSLIKLRVLGYLYHGNSRLLRPASAKSSEAVPDMALGSRGDVDSPNCRLK